MCPGKPEVTPSAASRFRSELSESTPGGVRDPDGAQTREGLAWRGRVPLLPLCPPSARRHVTAPKRGGRIGAAVAGGTENVCPHPACPSVAPSQAEAPCRRSAPPGT